MRIVAINKLEEDMLVGKTVFSEDGRILLQEGVCLTNPFIEKLYDKNIPCIYVKDDLSENIEPMDTIEPALKLKAVQNLKNIMEEATPVKGIIQKKNKIFISKRTMVNIRDVVMDIMTSLKSNEGSLVRIVEMMGSDLYTYTHSVNVSIISLMIGLEVMKDLNKDEMDKKLNALGMGALLHDIGKSMVSPEILHKPGKLTEQEMDKMKKHVTLGYDMIKDIEEINSMQYSGIVKGCILLHHENLDGTGYPYGWKNDKLKDYVRIMRIADMYSAMTSDKVYKKKVPPYEALEKISSMCFSKVDADIFKILKAKLALYPEGTGVLLNTGEKAIVTKNNETMADRPLVKVIYNAEGNKHKGFKMLNLMKERTYFVNDTTEF